MKNLPKGFISSTEKNGRIIYTAEIQYQGKRYKHKGSPNRETVERWLDRKREYIENVYREKEKRLSEFLEETKLNDQKREIVVNKADYKGNISTYKTLRKGKMITRHIAEIQCLGMRIRKTSIDKAFLEQWIEDARNGLNVIRNQYKKEIEDNYTSYLAKEKEIRAKEQQELVEYLSSFGLKVENYVEKQDKLRIKSYQGIYTYILEDCASGIFKIGKTKNLKSRLAQFCNPSYVYRYVYLGDIEKVLHKKFEHRRLNGEWFELTVGDIENIKKDYVIYCISVD